MAYDLIKISALPAATPDESQDIVVGVGDLAKRINYGDVKADMVGTEPTYTTDTEPYLMRQTAHVGVVGKCALNKLVGGSLGWNQLVANGNFESTSSWTARQSTISVANNTANVTPSSNGTERGLQSANYLKATAGHKYIIKVDVNSPITSNVNLSFGGANAIARAVTASAWVAASCVYEATVTATTALYALIAGTTTTSQTIQYRNAMSTDLTLDFGSTIADYVYGLEQATAGSGIAWLSKYIDLGTYHAYDAGSIQSVQATEHVTLSKNFLTDYEGHGTTYTISGVTFTQNPDGTITLNGTATAAVTYYLAVRQRNFYLPKGSYILSGTPTGYIQYTLRLGINRGASGATVGNDLGSGFAFTEATGETYGVWIAFDSGAVFNNVVMKPMIRFASADSTYVPYQKHTYTLGSDTLRGIPQLVSNKLSYDGDEKYPDGTIKRKYGSRAYQSGDTSDGATMITDGTTTVYKLATPTTESSTAFQKVQTIDADGTESFTTSSPVPVGHETQTPDNILAALGWLGE